MSTLGSRLRKVRGAKSQLMFAKEAGVTQNTLSRYELDKGRPDADFLSFVCTTCNVSPNWLLLGVEDNGPEFLEEGNYRKYPEEMGAGYAAATVRVIESDAIAERAERRELALENRRLYKQVEQLLRENAYLRVRLAEAGIVLPMSVPSPEESAAREQDAATPDGKDEEKKAGGKKADARKAEKGEKRARDRKVDKDGKVEAKIRSRRTRTAAAEPDAGAPADAPVDEPVDASVEAPLAAVSEPERLPETD